jgi:PPOX class probable F420-dependent enzyme
MSYFMIGWGWRQYNPEILIIGLFRLGYNPRNTFDLLAYIAVVIMTDSTFDSLLRQQFIALTTFRKSGAGVVTPVWFIHDAGKLYVWTSAESGKVKRLRQNPWISLVHSDYSGKPLGEPMRGMVSFPPKEEWKALKKQFQSKYGVQFNVFSNLSRLRGGDNNLFLEISPADEPRVNLDPMKEITHE